MSDVTKAGATGDSSVRCAFCGGSPVLNRALGAGPGGTGICRDCVVGLTKNFTDTVAGSSGVVDKPLGLAESTADENVLWEGFDIALSRMSLLQGVERQIAFAQESIRTSWKADSADKLPTRVNEDVACVVALLKRHGYHEVSVVVGINTALAARGELGGFYEKPDPSDPRWSARMQFDRDESPSPTSG
jgi:hypothetical protein